MPVKDLRLEELLRYGFSGGSLLIVVLLMQSLLAIPTLPEAVGRQTSESKDKALPVYSDEEGYEVLSVVLRNDADFDRKSKLVLHERSDVVDKPDFCEVPPEFQSAADDLRMKAKNEVRFERKFSLIHEYQLTRDSDAPGWGITVVGFNSERTRAVVAASDFCGFLCGSGRTYLLWKMKSGWEIIDRRCRWIS